MFEDLDERRRKIQDRHVEIELTNQFTKTGRILDIGCGPGLYFEGLSGQQKLFAVEASPSAARYVTERFSATVQTARVEDAEFDDESFDVINLTYVIEHLQDPVGIMQKATSGGTVADLLSKLG
jgi:2-polyprenyl-3-methyl-5-hydroxy-6-metoxy-1,4-benzoquinol methylase